MTRHVFFRLDAQQRIERTRPIAAPWAATFWRPSPTRIRPPGLAWPVALVWWGMHYTGMFRNDGYGQLCIHHERRLVHRSSVFPGWFRFPFMRSHDLQIGNTWTADAYRGMGLATDALRRIIETTRAPGRSYWYVTEESNRASIRTAEKAGFVRVGYGVRTSRFGVRAAGAFRITSASAAADRLSERATER